MLAEQRGLRDERIADGGRLRVEQLAGEVLA